MKVLYTLMIVNGILELKREKLLIFIMEKLNKFMKNKLFLQL